MSYTTTDGAVVTPPFSVAYRTIVRRTQTDGYIMASAASSALDGEETILLADGDRFDLMEFRGICRNDDEREFDNWRAEEERSPSRA